MTALQSARFRPFVFLDRDGTLVEDKGYVHKLADYAPLPGALGACRALSEAGYLLAIVTNQSGIGRGLFSEADFWRFQRRLLRDLACWGVPIAATYLCPHRPEEGCACRKPAPGMLFRARDELGADLARSVVIGDSERDLEAGRRAGCRPGLRIDPADPEACPSLAAAVNRLLGTGS